MASRGAEPLRSPSPTSSPEAMLGRAAAIVSLLRRRVRERAVADTGRAVDGERARRRGRGGGGREQALARAHPGEEGGRGAGAVHAVADVVVEAARRRRPQVPRERRADRQLQGARGRRRGGGFLGAGYTGPGVDRAIDHLTQAIALAPDDLSIHQGRLHVAINSARTHDAPPLLADSLARYTGPDATEDWLAYAQELWDMRAADVGLEYMRVLEKRYPNDHRVVGNVGTFLIALKRDDEALGLPAPRRHAGAQRRDRQLEPGPLPREARRPGQRRAVLSQGGVAGKRSRASPGHGVQPGSVSHRAARDARGRLRAGGQGMWGPHPRMRRYPSCAVKPAMSQ